MKLKHAVLITFAISSYFFSGDLFANNPFQRPVIKEVKVDVEPVDVFKEPEVNPYANEAPANGPNYMPMTHQNPLLNKESVVFRGSINGINIYYDTSTGEYINDDSTVSKITLLSADLPELEKVNY